MFRRGLILFFLLANAFANSLPAQQLSFQTYTVRDGLIANPVRRIFQDSKGFIWIATWEGLSKYDGNKFTSFNTANGLSDNLINDLYETEDGKLLIAENNGSVDMMMTDGTIKRNFFKDAIVNRFFKTTTGKVLAITDKNGIYEIKNGNFFKPAQEVPDYTASMIVQLNDSLFTAASNMIPSFLQTFNHHYHSVAKIKNPALYISCLFKDSKQRLWVGTNQGLKLVLSSKNGSTILAFNFTSLPPPFDIAALKESLINDILEDAGGNFWIATSQALVKIQADGITRTFTEKNGLASSAVACLFEDKEKNIWIGTTEGLTKLANKINLEVYKKENGLASNTILNVLPVSPNHILVFTDRFCQVFDVLNNRFNYPGIGKKTVNNYNSDLLGVLLMQLKTGQARYDRYHNRIVNLYFPDPSGLPACAAMDSTGNIFLSMNDTLKIKSGKNLFTDSSWRYRIVTLLADKKGYVWVGTWDKGLYRLKCSLSKNDFHVSVKNFTSPIHSNNIRSSFLDSKGNIWIGTRYNGAFMLTEKHDGEYSVKHFHKQEGLTSEWVLTFGEDKEGNIWIGSALGLDKIIPSEKKFRIVNFSYLNNFFAAVYSIATANDKTIWCSTSNGLLHFSDNKLEETSPIPVYLTTASLGSAREKINGLHISNPVSLKYFQNQAFFEFSSPGFINEKQIKYSYRLKGSDDTAWDIPANIHNVSYGSLSPGHYSFQVRSLGWNNEFSSITTFNFIIQSPFWKTWWFAAICFLIFCFFLFAFYRYRINQLLKLQRVRNSIATDLHDEIGTSLTNIAILSELIHQDGGQRQNFLERITEEVSNSGQALDDIVWSINTKNDTLEQTVTRMRRYAAEVFEASGISYSLDMDEKFSSVKLSMEQRRDFFLLFKECINNIYKHAAAKNVEIKISVEKKTLHLLISDNGKGFDIKAATHGNGLKNIQHRTQKWKGKLQIDSETGKGTYINIFLPIVS